MTLQALTPEWLASPEGKLWKKKMRKRHDEIIVEALNAIEIPMKSEAIVLPKTEKNRELF